MERNFQFRERMLQRHRYDLTGGVKAAGDVEIDESFIIAIACFLRTFLYITVTTLVLTLVFTIAGLFCKVLAFVFEQAVEYKLENDLTI